MDDSFLREMTNQDHRNTVEVWNHFKHLVTSSSLFPLTGNLFLVTVLLSHIILSLWGQKSQHEGLLFETGQLNPKQQH